MLDVSDIKLLRTDTTCSGTGKRSKEWPFGTYLMDAVSLNVGPKPAETHIRLGDRFTKAWVIMNSGHFHGLIRLSFG